MIAYRHLCILCFFMHIHTVYARQMSSNPKNTCETQSMAVNSRRYKPGTCSKDLPVLDSKEVQSIAPPSCPDDCNHRGRWVAVGGWVLTEFAMLGAAVITCFWLRVWLVEDWLYQFSHSDLQPSERKAVNFEIAIVLTCRSSQHRPTILDILKLTVCCGQIFQTFTRQFVPYVWLGVFLINVTGVLMHQHDGHQRIRQDLQCRNSPLTDPKQQEDRSKQVWWSCQEVVLSIVGYLRTELPVSFLSCLSWATGAN